jgi:surfactin synthase thioesterase subunit
MTEVVERVSEEVAARGLSRVLLWGHSTGSALAIETAEELLERGVDVERVFVGAQLLGDPAERRANVAALRERGDAEIAAWLSGRTGYAELGELDAQRAEHVGAAYRHDILSAHRWFLDALEARLAARLGAPVTVVVAADDPATAGFETRYRDWERVAERVDLHELAGGGHYFLRTRPDEAARAVSRAARPLLVS